MTRPQSTDFYHQANRQSWNAATVAHNSHKGDQAAFFRAGGSTLYPEEISLLGDLNGKRVAHLQCNSGQDSLSVARLGASVTGIDISDEAITFAQTLSTESNIPATFVRADVIEWLHSTDQRFDAVFCSYGTVVWLADLVKWGHGIGRILKSGGRFVIVDFHPAMYIFGENGALTYDYGGGKVDLELDGVGDYVAETYSDADDQRQYVDTGVQNFQNPHAAYEFSWGLGDILNALIGGGLVIRRVEEYFYCNGFKYWGLPLQQGDGNRWVLPDDHAKIPMMYGIVAENP